jgi:hypothetical protein
MEASYQPAWPSDSYGMTSIAKTVPAQTIDSEFDTTSSDQSSVHKTIETPELLEHILSHLPSLDLYHARRVSQSFRNAIDRSPALQKNLFLVDRSSVPQKNCSLIPFAYSDSSTFGPISPIAYSSTSTTSRLHRPLNSIRVSFSWTSLKHGLLPTSTPF